MPSASRSRFLTAGAGCSGTTGEKGEREQIGMAIHDGEDLGFPETSDHR
jgi:hypothetical protein